MARVVAFDKAIRHKCMIIIKSINRSSMDMSRAMSTKLECIDTNIFSVNDTKSPGLCLAKNMVAFFRVIPCVKAAPLLCNTASSWLGVLKNMAKLTGPKEILQSGNGVTVILSSKF